jgi:hypothetical protein
MKKVMALMLLLGMGSLALAQLLPVGLKGGLNMATITGNDAKGAITYPGVVVGCYCTIGLLPSVAIQPEILYSQKGWKVSDFFGVPGIGKFRIDYIEISLLAKLSFGVIVRPYILVGTYFSNRIRTSWESASGGNDFYGSLDNYVKRYDRGIILGAGVPTPIKLSFEVRYSLGFSTISEEMSGITPVWKNSTISVLVGFSKF